MSRTIALRWNHAVVGMLLISFVWTAVVTRLYKRCRYEAAARPSVSDDVVGDLGYASLNLLGTRLDSVHVQSLSGRPLQVPIRRGRITLLILLGASDCGACLAEYRVWNHIRKQFPDTLVDILAVVHDDPVRARGWAADFSIRFPVYVDPNGRFWRRLGLEGISPARIIVGRSGRVLHVGRPRGDSRTARALVSVLERLLRVRTEG